jgi:hypothetical protein
MSAADENSVPLSALDDNFLEANRLFVADAKRGEYLERRDVAIACCGLPAETLNWGFLKPPYPDLAATAAAVRAYFDERKLVFNLTFRDPEPQKVLAPLEALGWRRREDPTPGMTLALPAAVPAVAAPLSIERVRTPAQFAVFREAAFRGFGFPPAIAPRPDNGNKDGDSAATRLCDLTDILWVDAANRQMRNTWKLLHKRAKIGNAFWFTVWLEC